MAKVVTTRLAASPLSSKSVPADSHPPFENMVWIPGGTFLTGSDRHYPEEAPVHKETASGFWMDTYLVTNADFADLRNHFHWWTYVPGANRRHPMGPESSLEELHDHPVVHVAYEDVETYAMWAGKEVPSEAEWEFAARGGLEGRIYTWGNEFAPQGKMMANAWQGEFPMQNLLLDGFERTSPVGSFPANGYGLYDMAGNVWEWTSDWYREHHAVKACCFGRAKGNAREKSHDPLTPNIRIPRKVLKGGSYLCAANYCLRYRPAARIPQQVDTGTCHQGFRCIARASTRDAPPAFR